MWNCWAYNIKLLWFLKMSNLNVILLELTRVFIAPRCHTEHKISTKNDPTLPYCTYNEYYLLPHAAIVYIK